MKYTGTIILTLVFAVLTVPSTALAKRPVVKASMLVNGTITVSTDGHVKSYTLDQPDKLPAPVIRLLAQTVPHWRFQPVLRHGKAVNAKAKMHVRIVANPIAHEKYALTIGGSRFGDDTVGKDAATDPAVRLDHSAPHRSPTYPRPLVLGHIYGNVYLLVRINRQGHVDKIAAEEVDLKVRGAPARMKRWRRELAESAIDAIKRWTFIPPTSGPHADQDHWYAQVPVKYFLNGIGRHKPRYGEWEVYLPGPRRLIPWADSHEIAAGNVNAVPSSGIYTADQELHKIAPPDNS